ncbi:glycosyl transferase family 1 [Paenibacillus sp. BK033]|uniref:glycosyltransferase n=1 Tax=Paenibacillus sp. BK033 TaxID=2512133 RepID=UPI0010DA9F8F|nr:glycosyltransferase [Paenibacillus sp. BK033]TCM98955.1 glycosyl transferase family 1 [Paenibacillus sp. BK033]
MKKRHKTGRKSKQPRKAKSRTRKSGARSRPSGKRTAKRKSRRKHRRLFKKRRTRQPAAERATLQSEASLREPGVNIIGFVHAEMGIGESSRLAAKAIDTAAIPFGLLNFPLAVASRMSDYSWSHKLLDKARYNTNIFHMNADFMRPAREHFGNELFNGRYNIGYWHWELPEFPDEHVEGFSHVNEVWVSSKFVAESVSKRASVPVITIPHCIQVQVAPNINRSSFGLPENRFLFLMMYDVQSSTLRKNPRAVIEAFKLAFDKNDQRVGLVLKVNNPDFRPNELAELKKLIAERSNVHLMDKVLTRYEVNALLQCTDSYVSLHRAEGFGLGLAEAMYLGKPVIATNWSGNTEFMNASNSCPVSYQLVNIGQDWGPYKSHQIWAEPNIRHASEYMQRLVTDTRWRESIAASGMRTIHNEFSPAVIGQRIKNRLRELRLI